jgi:hypothetical protein
LYLSSIKLYLFSTELYVNETTVLFEKRMQYCLPFTNILFQFDINSAVRNWNSHRISSYRNMNCVHGRPFLLYHTPQIVGRHRQLHAVSLQAVEACKPLCETKDCPCDRDIFELCCLLMAENNWDQPKNAEEAVHLYMSLRHVILQHV